MRRFERIALVLVLCAIALPVWASGGRIPIYQLPMAIDQPGSYYLTRDLSGSGGGPLISISASNVTLDLAGHTIERTDGVDAVIGTEGAPTNIEVFGGRVIGGYHSLHLYNYTGSTFNVRIHDLMVGGAAGSGIFVESGYEVIVPAQVRIERCEVWDAAARGIHVFAMDAGRIENNVVRNSGQSGITVESSEGVTVLHNTSSRNAVHGIEILNSGATAVERNTSAYNDEFGLMFNGSQDALVYTNCYIDNRLLMNTSGEIGRLNETIYESRPCPPND